MLETVIRASQYFVSFVLSCLGLNWWVGLVSWVGGLGWWVPGADDRDAVARSQQDEEEGREGSEGIVPLLGIV